MASPFTRVPWNKYEVALLIRSLNSVSSGNESRKEAVSKLSKRLRNGMLLLGFNVSDKYRNENGIDLQMSAMEFYLSKGERGIPTGSKLFREILQMFLSDRDSFSALLSDAEYLYPESLDNDFLGVSSINEANDGSPTLAIIKDILSRHFKTGYKMHSCLHCGRFIRLYNEETGMKLDEINDELSLAIKSCGVESKGKIFIPESIMSADTRKAIFDYISATFSSIREYVFYDTIFKRFHDELLASAIADADEGLLRSYLQFYFGDRWSFNSRYVALSNIISVSIEDEVIDFIREQGKPVMVDDVVEALYWLPENDVRQTFGRNPSILVNSGNNSRFHIDIFVISKEQLDKISGIIQATIGKYAFMSTKELISDIKRLLPEVIANNSSIPEFGIGKAISIHLSHKFAFVKSVISEYGRNLNPKETLISYAKAKESFSLSEINSLAESMGTTLNCHMASIYDYSIRINDDTFIARKSVSFETTSIDHALDGIFPQKVDFMPLSGVSNFSGFPENDFPWNQWLLESYLLTCNSRYGLLYNEYLNKNHISGAIINMANCQNWTFHDLVANALARSNVKLQKDDALCFLADKGYIARKRYGNIDADIETAKFIRKSLNTLNE